MIGEQEKRLYQLATSLARRLGRRVKALELLTGDDHELRIALLSSRVDVLQGLLKVAVERGSDQAKLIEKLTTLAEQNQRRLDNINERLRVVGEWMELANLAGINNSQAVIASAKRIEALEAAEKMRGVIGA